MLLLPKELIENLKIGDSLIIDGEELMIVDKGFCYWAFQAKDRSFKTLIVRDILSKKYIKEYTNP